MAYPEHPAARLVELIDRLDAVADTIEVLSSAASTLDGNRSTGLPVNGAALASTLARLVPEFSQIMVGLNETAAAMRRGNLESRKLARCIELQPRDVA